MLKINEEVSTKLLISLSAQYIEVMNMAMNKEEISYLTIPKIQGSDLHFLILKLSKLEKDIKNINSLKGLVEKIEE